ncbi:hypothetical protein DICPUDRAFT_148215, partial [Dictyostelium purpureum]
ATIKFNQVLPSLKNGTLCLAGHNNILPDWNPLNNGTILLDSCVPTNYNSSLIPKGSEEIPCDNCHNAYIIILCYMTINVVYNIFILLVIKHAGATVFSIANTLRLPLTNIVFSLKFIMGINVSPFSGLSIAGLIIILLGLSGYRVASMVKAKKAAAAGGGEVTIRVIPGMGPAGMEVMPNPTPLIKPKSPDHLRNQFFSKIGIQVPDNRFKNTNNNV